MYSSEVENSASALLRLIRDYGQERSYAPRDVIYPEGKHPDGFYYVQSGLVGLGKLALNGKQSLLRIYSKHCFFGYRSLLGQDDYYASTVALKSCQLLYFPFKSIAELQEKVPEVFRYFTIFLSSELKEAEIRIFRASSMKMKHRVIDSLIYLNKNHCNYSWTYREIGEFCGGETATVIRICNQLKTAGALKKESRHWKIVDEKKLRELREQY